MVATSFGLVTVARALAEGWLPANVFLDGVEIRDVRTLNDVEGWVEVYVKDQQGYHAVDTHENEPITERKHGVVSYIPWPDGKPGVWNDTGHSG